MNIYEIIKHQLNKADVMKTATGIAVLLFYFLIVRALIYYSIPVENKEPLIHVLGTLDGILAMIVGYYFGSSKGSQEKQEIISKHVGNEKNSNNPN